MYPSAHPSILPSIQYSLIHLSIFPFFHPCAHPSSEQTNQPPLIQTNKINNPTATHLNKDSPIQTTHPTKQTANTHPNNKQTPPIHTSKTLTQTPIQTSDKHSPIQTNNKHSPIQITPTQPNKQTLTYKTTNTHQTNNKNSPIQMNNKHSPIRAVVLESGLETFFYRLGLVLDSLVFGLRLVSDLVIGLAKCSSWSRPSPAIYAFFFSFKTKTRLFRKWVM